jgi:hypothetical protein
VALELERIDVDDVATNPERIATEIHRQLGDIAGPIPVYDIARALDIDEIQEKPLNGLEGVLITEPQRDFGIIHVNSGSSRQRRRYSVAHELGHFLSQWHKQTSNAGFQCTRQDMAQPAGDDVHVSQESEANRFAIELLAPARLVSRYLRRLPDLEHVLSLAADVKISKVAAARRYVSLHSKPLAVVFAKDGEFRYVDRGPAFPFVALNRGQRLPDLPPIGTDAATSEMVEANGEDWLGLNRAVDLAVQVLRQEDGYLIILLHLDNQELDSE